MANNYLAIPDLSHLTAPSESDLLLPNYTCTLADGHMHKHVTIDTITKLPPKREGRRYVSMWHMWQA